MKELQATISLESTKETLQEDVVIKAQVQANSVTLTIPRYNISTEFSVLESEFGTTQTATLKRGHSSTVSLENRPHISVYWSLPNTEEIQLDGFAERLTQVDSVHLYDALDKMQTEARQTIRKQTTPASVFDSSAFPVPEFSLKATTKTVGRKSSRRDVYCELLTDNQEEWTLWRKLVASHPGIYHSFKGELIAPDGVADGETLTLHEYIDKWYYLDAQTVLDRHAVLTTDPTDFATGEIIKWKDSNGNFNYGVISELKYDDLESLETKRKVANSGAALQMDTDKNGFIRIGYSNMMGEVTSIKRLTQSELRPDAPDWVTNVREAILQKQTNREAANDENIEIADRREIKTNGRQNEIAEVLTVTGDFGEAVIECRNIFDFGFVCDIKRGTVSEATESVLKQFARDNTNIPTSIRM